MPPSPPSEGAPPSRLPRPPHPRIRTKATQHTSNAPISRIGRDRRDPPPSRLPRPPRLPRPEPLGRGPVCPDVGRGLGGWYCCDGAWGRGAAACSSRSLRRGASARSRRPGGVSPLGRRRPARTTGFLSRSDPESRSESLIMPPVPSILDNETSIGRHGWAVNRCVRAGRRPCGASTAPRYARACPRDTSNPRDASRSRRRF